MSWHYNPHSGGKPITPQVQVRVRARILAYAAKVYSGKYDRIHVRFKAAFCYIDAYCEKSPNPTHLVRLRYFGHDDRWSLAFFAYSSEKYEPSVFMDGTFEGTVEDAFDVGAVYLQ